MTSSNPEIPILDVENLSVSFAQAHRRLSVLDEISFTLSRGKILGIVGESGSGKSVTALAIAGLLSEQGRIDRGHIRLAGRDLASLPRDEKRRVRGSELAMIFQEPMSSLNPLLPVGFQIAEGLIEHRGIGRRQAQLRAIELMTKVGIADPERRARSYPHQLSGGMRQRAMIAIAIACQPKLLLADEPTTALDVTIQAQILDLLRGLRDASGMAMILITHDLGVVAEIADRVLVMYAGQIVEEAPIEDLFAAPAHPYTRLLLRSIPSITAKRSSLEAVPGATPSPAMMPAGCRFHPRCPHAIDKCRAEGPPLEATIPSRRVRCWRVGEIDTPGSRAG